LITSEATRRYATTQACCYSFGDCRLKSEFDPDIAEVIRSLVIHMNASGTPL
ncbi:7649_t:CDS:2, partial [Scutellospora calospora]